MNSVTEQAEKAIEKVGQAQQAYTCIICPNGCDITATLAPNGTLLSCTGQLCPRGVDYVTQELTDPRRNIATSVRVVGGAAPITSVRLSNVIPKAEIFNVMAQINAKSIPAPVQIGDVVIANVLGLGVDVIVTKPIAAQ